EPVLLDGLEPLLPVRRRPLGVGGHLRRDVRALAVPVLRLVAENDGGAAHDGAVVGAGDGVTPGQLHLGDDGVVLVVLVHLAGGAFGVRGAAAGLQPDHPAADGDTVLPAGADLVALVVEEGDGLLGGAPVGVDPPLALLAFVLPGGALTELGEGVGQLLPLPAVGEVVV